MWKIESLIEQLDAVSKSKNKKKRALMETIVNRAYVVGKEDAKEEIRLALGIEPCNCRTHEPYD